MKIRDRYKFLKAVGGVDGEKVALCHLPTNVHF